MASLRKCLGLALALLLTQAAVAEEYETANTPAEYEVNVIVASRSGSVAMMVVADWCRECETAMLMARELALKAQVRFVVLDLMANPSVPQKLRLRSVPALVMFRDGEPVDPLYAVSAASIVDYFSD